MIDPKDRIPIRAADIKEMNERLVLGMVFRAGRASQSEVVTASSLKAPTVFRIFGELVRAGLIVAVLPSPLAPEKKGRRPTWYAAVPGAYRAVGLDFWAGSASVVVEDFSAGVLYGESRAVPYGSDADGVYAIVSGLIADALERAPGGPLLGIGIGAPGVVDLARGEVQDYKRIPGLSGFPLAKELEARFGTVVRMCNNATVAATAAYRYGSSADAGSLGGAGVPRSKSVLDTDSAFAILVRSGVGGAFVRAGEPYQNGGKTAIEIGHMTMDPSGPACPCGGNGCLEAYLSEDALVAAVSRVVPCPDFSSLDRLLAAGDGPAIGAIGLALRQASIALLNATHLFNPGELIVISRSASLSSLIASSASAYLSEHPRSDGHVPKVRGVPWDPVLSGRAACDMVFDGFFSN